MESLTDAIDLLIHLFVFGVSMLMIAIRAGNRNDQPDLSIMFHLLQWNSSIGVPPLIDNLKIDGNNPTDG